VVNGRTEVGSDSVDCPLYILRRGVASEASVCLFGADADTGALAASRSTPIHPNPESSMERLNALLARHGDKHAARIALALKAGQSDDQIAATLSAAAESDHAAAITELTTKLTAATAALAEANAKLAAMDAKIKALQPATTEGDPAVPATEGESKNAAPKTLHEGMAQLSRENPKLTGFPLRSAALKRWPALRSTVPKA
jgi:hypothetical protein